MQRQITCLILLTLMTSYPVNPKPYEADRTSNGKLSNKYKEPIRTQRTKVGQPITIQARYRNVEDGGIIIKANQSEEVVIVQTAPSRAIISGFDYDLSRLQGLEFHAEDGDKFILRLSQKSSSSSHHCEDTVYKVIRTSSTNGSSDCLGYGQVDSAKFTLIDKPLGIDGFIQSSKFNERLDDVIGNNSWSSSPSSSSSRSSSSSSSSSTAVKKKNTKKVISISYRNRNRNTSAILFLTCDIFRTDGLLRVVWQSRDQRSVHLELRHLCCCPDACSKNSPTIFPKKNDDDDDDVEDDDNYGDDDDDDQISTTIKNSAIIAHDDFDDDVDIILENQNHKYIWIIIVINVAIVTGAVFIAAFCCRRAGIATGDGPYNYLPKPWTNQISIHSSRNSIYHQFTGSHVMLANKRIAREYNDDDDFVDRLPPPMNKASAASRDYLTSREQQDSQLLSLSEAAECHVIRGQNLDLRQRLGGGVFGDSYLAIWSKRKVAAKRIVVGLHGNQTESLEDRLKFIVQSVTHLAKLRHRYLVTVLGVCVETKRPYIVQEYVEGACLKTLLKRSGSNESLTWKKKLKMGRQIAEGMSYLHSLDPPLLHRDLRCSNVFLDSTSKVKLGDFGFVRIFQTLRNQCEGEKNCFCEKSTSAFPSTIRWTAPEILRSPRSEEHFRHFSRSSSTIAASAHSSFRSLAEPTASSNESVSDVITPPCDVYSFGMIMWEMVSHADPFDDVIDETEVINHVLEGYRPGIQPTLTGRSVFPSPHYRDLMEICWDHKSDKRPSFKQILVCFKSMVQIVDESQEIKHNQQNLENATNFYLKSTLNVK